MTTVRELEDWMLHNGIKNTFTETGRFLTDEGFGLEKVSEIFIWYFIERVERQNLMYFTSEKDAVQFVYNYVRKIADNPAP